MEPHRLSDRGHAGHAKLPSNMVHGATRPDSTHPLFHLDNVSSLLQHKIFRSLNSSTLLSWQRRIANRTDSSLAWLVRPLAGRRPRRCAVVGSSGLLLGARLGARIDAHDAVIRMNTAPMRGFEADVGQRTSLLLATLIPWRHLMRQNPRPHVPVIEYCNQPWLSICWTSIAEGDPVLKAKQVWADGARISPLLAARAAASMRLRRGSQASTGAIGVLLALELCDSVTAFGFGANSTACAKYYACMNSATYTGRKELRLPAGAASPTRAFQGHTEPAGWHDFGAEMRWLQALEAAGTLRLRGSERAAAPADAPAAAASAAAPARRNVRAAVTGGAHAPSHGRASGRGSKS